ncbi:unnamed protein product [Notodromas monacha]|uniref:Uncharacterized protein n=1 Tax=Notodromas monacha TaxID=399045 RepID=A0A7R9BWC9_9CRUS|nr:unnamed protein product [Notodromas monacha]CAG0922948.1 unnamed protein product [Notodromas monacha]
MYNTGVLQYTKPGNSRDRVGITERIGKVTHLCMGASIAQKGSVIFEESRAFSASRQTRTSFPAYAGVLEISEAAAGFPGELVKREEEEEGISSSELLFPFATFIQSLNSVSELEFQVDIPENSTVKELDAQIARGPAKAVNHAGFDDDDDNSGRIIDATSSSSEGFRFTGNENKASGYSEGGLEIVSPIPARIHYRTMPPPRNEPGPAAAGNRASFPSSASSRLSGNSATLGIDKSQSSQSHATAAVCEVQGHLPARMTHHPLIVSYLHAVGSLRGPAKAVNHAGFDDDDDNSGRIGNRKVEERNFCKIDATSSSSEGFRFTGNENKASGYSEGGLEIVSPIPARIHYRTMPPPRNEPGPAAAGNRASFPSSASSRLSGNSATLGIDKSQSSQSHATAAVCEVQGHLPARMTHHPLIVSYLHAVGSLRATLASLLFPHPTPARSSWKKLEHLTRAESRFNYRGFGPGDQFVSGHLFARVSSRGSSGGNPKAAHKHAQILDAAIGTQYAHYYTKYTLNLFLFFVWLRPTRGTEFLISDERRKTN